MYRQIRSLLLSALCLTLVALTAGCPGRRDAGDTTAERTPDLTPTVTDAPVRVTDVRVGRNVGPDRRITDETTQFRPQDTIYASVVTEGTAQNVTLAARWTFEDGQQVDQTSQTISPTGTAVSEFHVSHPQGWPQGRYQVEILVNGSRAASRDFQVQ